MSSKRNYKQLAAIGGGVILLVIVGAWLWLANTRSQASDIAANKYQQGDIEGAAAEYKQLLDKYGGTAEIWTNYGNTLRDLKRYDEAASVYLQAIQIDASYYPVYRNLSYLYVDLAADRNQPDKIDEAIKIVETGFTKTGSRLVYLAEDLIMLYGRKGDQAQVQKWQQIREALLEEE